MDAKKKLELLMSLIRTKQAEAAEAYNQTTYFISQGGYSFNATEACYILDPLLEEAEKIYNLPEREL